MKKYIIATIIVLGLAGSVYAKSTTPNKGNFPPGNEMVASSSQQNRFEERKGDIFDTKISKVSTRLEATISRLEKIMKRVESRIEKIKNAGGDTTVATKYVSEAKESLNKAKTAFLEIKDKTNQFRNSNNLASTTVEIIKSLKDIAQTIEKNLKNAHVALQKAVGDLKGRLNNTDTTETN